MFKSSIKVPAQAARTRWQGVIALSLLVSSNTVYASNGDYNPGAEGVARKADGGFFELGFVVQGERRIRHAEDPDKSDFHELGIGLDFSAGYRRGRLFIEATESGFGGLNAGITLAESEHWDVDLLLANISGTVSVESDKPPAPVTEGERNRALVDRDSLYIAAGGRVSGYFGDNIVQLNVVSDWYDGNGILGSLRAGRQWQLGNWNAQTIAGVRYYSSEFNDYQFGVDANEQSARFPAYTAGNAWIPEVEFALSVPVRENWVYSSRLRLTRFPDSVTDSPLVNRDDAYSLSTGLYYVF